jgi:hypothetical protein
VVGERGVAGEETEDGDGLEVESELGLLCECQTSPKMLSVIARRDGRIPAVYRLGLRVSMVGECGGEAGAPVGVEGGGNGGEGGITRWGVDDRTMLDMSLTTSLLSATLAPTLGGGDVACGPSWHADQRIGLSLHSSLHPSMALHPIVPLMLCIQRLALALLFALAMAC